MVFLVIKKMKTTRIAIALVAVVGLSAIIVGLAFAHYSRNSPFSPATGNIAENFDENWWTEMEEYMEARWQRIEDEEWYDDMVQYMKEHWNEVQNKEWFNQMIEYMENQGYSHFYGYRNYDSNYYSPRNYGGRGFGCRGW